MWHGDWSWWGWLGMSLSMVAFWVIVIGGAVLVFHRVGGRAVDSDPERVLAQRFARGEIDEEEYRRRRQVLHDDARRAGR